MSNRDEQFAGFARLLWQKIADRINALDDECNKTEEVVDGCVMCNLKPERIAAIIEPIIARAGYDLACHVVRNVDPAWENPVLKFREDTEEIVNDVPDLPELPEKEEK